MNFIGGGRVGGGVGWGWVLGVGGKPKAGNTIHKETNSNVVCSVLHRNSHSQPGRARRSPAAVLTPQAALLVPISGPIEPVVDRRGLQGRQKTPVKADLAIYSPIIGTYG